MRDRTAPRRRWTAVAATAVAVVVAAMTALTAGPAAADGTFHTAMYPLTPVGGAPLRSGFVVNIHANGPQIFAHENYQLNGAGADTAYDVVISVWTANTSCSGAPAFALPTATLTTNAGGNGQAQHVFTPADAAGLRHMMLGATWTLSSGGTVAYTTGCEVLTLD